MAYATLEDVPIGLKASRATTIAQKDVEYWMNMVGNRYGMHTDDAMAKGSRFGGPIVPGPFTLSHASGALAVVAEKLGIRAALVSISGRFRRPVRVGDTITWEAEVVEKIPDRNRVRYVITATNQNGEVVALGEAMDQLI